jgi:ribosome-associated protein
MIQDARQERTTAQPPEALRLALNAIQDLKGNHLVVLDLRGLNDATDFFVIASGTSDAHVRGIAESVMDKLDRRGHHTHHVEGLTGGRWVLLDFVDFVIHLFHPLLLPARAALERCPRAADQCYLDRGRLC